MKKQAGFTLIEMLLSVAIIGMLVGMSMPVYESFVRRNDLDLTTQTTAALIRRAAMYARTLNGDSSWSVEFQTSTITLFKGTDFAGRTTSFDETISVPGSITVGGLGEVQFTKFTGAPNTTGSVTLTSSLGDVKTVTVGTKGVIGYN